MQKKLKPRGKKVVKKPLRRSIVRKPSLLRNSLRFLPAFLIFMAALSLNAPTSASTNKKQLPGGVLSFATNVNNADLLAQTNNHRAQNNIASLVLNAQLNNAAQTKASDMVARNYWSHVSPTGQQPWFFIEQAGYSYSAAGENLAYGFDTSSDTITGWMNSPPHRDNILNGVYREVGFGTANSENYVDSGQQTVVVAMYGAPLSQSTPTATSPPAPTPAPQTKQSAVETVQETPKTEPLPAPAQSLPAEETAQNTPPSSAESVVAPSAATTATPAAKPVNVRRIQVLTGGNARWSSTLLVLAVFAIGILWTLQRGLEIKRLMDAGERFFLHHIHLDLTVVSFIVLGYTLLQTTGTIR